MLEVAPQALFELAPLELPELDPDAAADRVNQAFAEEREALVEPVGLDALDAEPFRQAGVELEERLVRDRAAEAGIDLAVDRARVDDSLDEPDRRAVGEGLELGH